MLFNPSILGFIVVGVVVIIAFALNATKTKGKPGINNDLWTHLDPMNTQQHMANHMMMQDMMMHDDLEKQNHHDDN